MQVQVQTADVATFCLGERAHPSLCVMIPCRRKCPAGAGEMKCIFCDCESCLEQAASARELQEAALLEGPTQAATPTEEEVLLAADSRRLGLSQLIQQLQGLPDSALSELSQLIDKIRQ